MPICHPPSPLNLTISSITQTNRNTFGTSSDKIKMSRLHFFTKAQARSMTFFGHSYEMNISMRLLHHTNVGIVLIVHVERELSKIRPTLQLMATTTRTRTIALAAMVVVFLLTTPTQALVPTSLRGNNTRGNATSPFPTLVRINTAVKDDNATVRQAAPGNDDWYDEEEEEELYVFNHTIVCPPSSSLASVGWIRRPLEVHPRVSLHATDQQHPRLGWNTTNTTKKVFGVNYGNIFIPEDWMLETDRTDFFQNDTTSFSVDANNDPNRLCLAGLPPDQFEVRYLTRLETMIQEEDFRRMAASGITVVRVVHKCCKAPETYNEEGYGVVKYTLKIQCACPDGGGDGYSL